MIPGRVGRTRQYVTLQQFLQNSSFHSENSKWLERNVIRPTWHVECVN